MATPERVGLTLPGGWLVLSPTSVRHCKNALALAVRSSRRDAIPLPAAVRDLVSLLAEAVEASGLPGAEVPNGASGSLSERSGLGPIASMGAGLGPRSLVDVGSAAEHLGITDRGVRDLCTRGALPAEKVAGRWLIDWPDLEEFAQLRAARREGSSNATAAHGEAQAG